VTKNMPQAPTLGAPQREKGFSRYEMDLFGLTLYIMTIIWLGFAVTFFQANPETQRHFYFLLIFCFLGAGAFMFGMSIVYRFSVLDIIFIVLLGLPLLAMGIRSVMAAGSLNVSALTVAYNLSIGVAEEMFFRGFILLMILRVLSPYGGFGKIIAYILDAFAFSLYHAYAYGGNATIMIWPFIAALYFCFVMDITGKISYVMIIHGIYDLLLAIAAGGGVPF